MTILKELKLRKKKLHAYDISLMHGSY